MPERCAYCLDDKNVNGICLECRSKLEKARRDIEYWKKESEGYRRMYFRLLNEKQRQTERRQRAKRK